jgi:signal transduction histidine kinase
LINLNTVVKELWKELAGSLGADIETELKLAEHLCNACADRELVESLIAELVRNARDAMPEGGRLVIETANVELDSKTESFPYSDGCYESLGTDIPVGPYVMLAVNDSGIGMATETKANIFMPFFTTKARGKGTGLGLSMVYSVVAQSKGYIRVYSEISKGTTFEIYLRRADS